MQGGKGREREEGKGREGILFVLFWLLVLHGFFFG